MLIDLLDLNHTSYISILDRLHTSSLDNLSLSTVTLLFLRLHLRKNGTSAYPYSIYVDPYGELRLHVEYKAGTWSVITKIFVSSKVMRLASPVWNVMFDHQERWAE